MPHAQRCSTGEIRSSGLQPAGYSSSTFKHKSHFMAKQASVDQTIARNKQDHFRIIWQGKTKPNCQWQFYQVMMINNFVLSICHLTCFSKV